jgi:N6-L-threonylcarbamoyladenine synthase
MEQHQRFGGIIPEIAARAHLESIEFVIDQALTEAQLQLDEIEVIGVAAGPGLAAASAVGVQFGKSLAQSLKIPIYGVNHIIAHCDIATMLNDQPNPELRYPLIALIVSGGHCTLYLVNNFSDAITVLGSTLDDAPGECFDKVGRFWGLDYPAGPIIDRLAQTGNPQAVEFPQGLTAPKFLPNHRFDFSFSGVKSAVTRYSGDADLPDLAASFSNAVVSVLVNKTLDAANTYKVKQIVVGGGFSANSMLRQQMSEAALRQNCEAFFPPLKYCTDNGAMIAKLTFDLAATGVSPSPIDFTIDSAMPADLIAYV